MYSLYPFYNATTTVTFVSLISFSALFDFFANVNALMSAGVAAEMSLIVSGSKPLRLFDSYNSINQVSKVIRECNYTTCLPFARDVFGSSNSHEKHTGKLVRLQVPPTRNDSSFPSVVSPQAQQCPPFLFSGGKLLYSTLLGKIKVSS